LVYFRHLTHFGHANIVRYCKRPQLQPGDEVITEVDGRQIANWVSPQIAEARKKEMDLFLVDNHNKTVTPDDIVYHDGDFCFGDWQDAVRYLEMLNFKRFYFIWGNHDHAMEELFEMVKAKRAPQIMKKVTFLGDMKQIKINGQRITLCHYAMRTFNKSHRGAWQLYGHSHGTLPNDPNILSFDIGVDCHNYQPISFERVQQIMSTKTFKPIDHHGK